MPIGDNIELGSGTLYYKGEEGFAEIGEVSEISVATEEEHAEDMNYISVGSGPFEFELDGKFTSDWTLVKCKRCHGARFPVTIFYAMLYGTDDWVCPACKAYEMLEKHLEAMKNDRIY